MFVKLLHDYGSIDKDYHQKGYYVACESIQSKKMFQLPCFLQICQDVLGMK